MSGTASIWGGSTVINSTANADNSYLTQVFGTPTAGQTVFNLTVFAYAVGTASLDIFVNGVRQNLGSDFTETSASSFTFTTTDIETTDVIVAVGKVGLTGANNAAASAAASAASAASALASYNAILALSLPSLPLAIANGGTGQTTKAAAFLALAPAPVINKVLGSTDGINYSLMSQGISTGTQITGDTTLTAANIGYHQTIMTAIASSITLPAANTLTIGGPRAVIDNTKGYYPVAIRSSTGTLIAAVGSGGIAFVNLQDSSTAGGVWSVTGNNIESGIITVDTTLVSTVSSAMYPFCVDLNGSVSVHFAKNSTNNGLVAILVDSGGKVINTPVNIVTGLGLANMVAAFKISATQLAVFYTTGTGTSYINVLTLTGASPTYSLSVGTQYNDNASSTDFNQELFTSAPTIVQLSATKYIATFNLAGSVTRAIGIDITAGVATFGAATSLNVFSGTQVPTFAPQIYALTATTALIVYSNNTSLVQVVVVTISGTAVVTQGSVATTGLSNNASSVPNVCILSATKAIITGEVTNVKVAVVTITGTAAVTGSAIVVEAAAYDLSYITNGASRQNPRLFTLTATTALFWYVDTTSSSGARTLVLTESAGSVTAGTIYYGQISRVATGSVGYGVMLPQGSLDFMAIKEQLASSTSVYNIIAQTFKINGNIITSGVAKPLRLIDQQLPDTVAVNRLGNDFVFTGYKVWSALQVLRNSGENIIDRGSISVPPLTLTGAKGGLNFNNITSNRLVLSGNTQHSGDTSSSGAFQLRVLHLELAA